MKLSVYYNGRSVEDFEVEYNNVPDKSPMFKRDNFVFNTIVPDTKTDECNKLFDLLQDFIDCYYNFKEVEDWSCYNFKSKIVMDDGEDKVEYKNLYPTSMNFFQDNCVSVEWCQSTAKGE